jgi:putative ABC transport system permease protein
MLKNYLKIAWRNLVKNKTFSIINIAGLAIGLACFTLIALYVMDELSYDRHNDKADRIYRIHSDIKMGNSDLHLAVASDPMGQALKKDYPQIEEYVRFYASSGSKLVKKGNEFIVEPNVAHVDSTVFNVFTFDVIHGDAKTALNEPNTVVLTETTARKYFGTAGVVGKMLETDDNRSTLYKVTAVIKDIPHNSHFNFDFLFSMDNVDYGFGNYMSHNFQTYLLLKPDADPKQIEKNFDQYIEKYVLPMARQSMRVASMTEFRKSGNNLSYSLMPLTDIHLHSDRFPELAVNGNVQYVYIFSIVALFILLIACVNFMNLSTARSANRAREVGIRKVLGTGKNSLIRQFLAESTFTVFLSMIIAIIIAWLVLPYFNDLSSKSLSVKSLLNTKTLPFFILLPIVVGIVAGSYPAFFLSSFQPIQVLKGKLNAGAKRSTLRSSLVVFQFVTSIVLIIGTIVVYRQLNYIQTRKLGFNKDQVLVIDGTGSLRNNATVFKNEVAKFPGVVNAAFTGFLPVENSSRTDNTFAKDAVLDTKNGFNMQNWAIDYEYIPTLGMEMKTGRNFSRDFGTDSLGIIINETTASLLGYDDAVGKKIYSLGGGPGSDPIPYTIIGVVKNFHFESLKRTIEPLCFTLGESSWATSFRINTTDVRGLVQQIESKWQLMASGLPFRYRFLDESFDEMYRAEQRVGKVAISFAVLAILIACLGLFGLATYMAEQRIKEIGVRKVLGASVTDIVSMLSKDFLKLVIIAALVAFPLAWWFMHKWLEDFAFRINIGWWIFLVAAGLALMIALITVSFQAIRAAMTNPVKSLRTE